MKKLIVIFSMMFFIMGNAFAQKGIQAAGVSLNYGTEISSIGLGVKYQYNITDNIRLEPSINYFFENKEWTCLTSTQLPTIWFQWQVTSAFILWPVLLMQDGPQILEMTVQKSLTTNSASTWVEVQNSTSPMN